MSGTVPALDYVQGLPLRSTWLSRARAASGTTSGRPTTCSPPTSRLTPSPTGSGMVELAGGRADHGLRPAADRAARMTLPLAVRTSTRRVLVATTIDQSGRQHEQDDHGGRAAQSPISLARPRSRRLDTASTTAGGGAGEGRRRPPGVPSTLAAAPGPMRRLAAGSRGVDRSWPARGHGATDRGRWTSGERGGWYRRSGGLRQRGNLWHLLVRAAVGRRHGVTIGMMSHGPSTGKASDRRARSVSRSTLHLLTSVTGGDHGGQIHVQRFRSRGVILGVCVAGIDCRGVLVEQKTQLRPAARPATTAAAGQAGRRHRARGRTGARLHGLDRELRRRRMGCVHGRDQHHAEGV